MDASAYDASAERQGVKFKKDQTRIQFGLDLVVPAACLLPAPKRTSTHDAHDARYRLLGTVVHSGKSNNAGHYVVRHP